MVTKTLPGPMRRAQGRRHYAENRNKILAKNRRWYAANREQCQAGCKRWREANTEKVRREAIENYGGACARCGIEDYRVLCFDHVNDDGAQMRRDGVHPRSGYPLHRWLKKNGWPRFIQLLCHNCNVLKQNYPESFHG